MKNLYRLVLVIILVIVIFFMLVSVFGSEINLDLIRLPPGFHISVYADNLDNPRSMTLGDKGVIFVGTRTAGKVYALLDKDSNGRPERVFTIATGLDMPNGVAVLDGDLYVAEVSRVLVYRGIEDRLDDVPEPEIVIDSYPNDRSHGWKYIAFGPDGNLYIPVGAPCNICNPSKEIYSTITRIKPDGTGFEIVARGIRNTVGFDWNPITGGLWFTDNGRDWLGEDVPPDELNELTWNGQHFGYPYCHGGDIPDPQYGRDVNCEEFEPPALKLGPHVAALGMKFYSGSLFPRDYQNQIFIAEHGSWNRSVPIGYRITLVRLLDNKPVSYEVFAEGWLQGRQSWGRPVDLLQLPDGSLLISDDKAGVIYKITYSDKD